MDKAKLQEAVDYFKDMPSYPSTAKLYDEEYIKNFAELFLVANNVLDGSLVEVAHSASPEVSPEAENKVEEAP
jgi:hypothetical protein